MRKTYDITEKIELEKIAKDILTRIGSRTDDNATVLALHGELGTGKTTFVQLLAKELGVTETITSPTFVIMKIYNSSYQAFAQLVHIDAYRVESIDEMLVLGFADLLKKKDTIICIEWAEKIKQLLPEDTVHLHFDLANDHTRTLTLD